MKLEEVLNSLPTKQRSSDEWRGKCPAHDGKSADSLSISIGDNGEALLYCHGGCSYNDITAALGVPSVNGHKPTERIAPPSPTLPATQEAKIDYNNPTAVYQYTDETGALLFEKCRYEPKTFRVRVKDGSRYSYRIGDTRRVLYNLPAVIASDEVFIVEGEKDADRLGAMGIVATTNFDGASSGKSKPKWDDSYNEFFTDKTVYIIPDNDEPGWAHAKHIRASITDIAKRVQLIELPDAGAGGDVSDWLDGGGTVEGLRELAIVGDGKPLTDDYKQEYKTQPLDHEGHARCVIAKYPNAYRFTPSHGWLFYNGKYWQRDGAEASLGRSIVSVLRERMELLKDAFADDPEADKKIRAIKRVCAANSFVVNGIRMRLIDQLEIQSSIESFDKDPYTLNCNNGVINLKTGELTPHDSNQLFTYCLKWDYNPSATCEDWVDFLDDSGETPDMVDYLQLVAGYSLTGDTSEEALFYIYGPTRSGKGTYTETLNNLLGPLSEGLNFKTFTAERTADTQNFDLAPLKNMRLVVASESRRHERMNEAVLKQVTGGDKVWCAHKGKPHFSYRPQYKIILTSNHPANADAQDTAAWERLRVIHFPHSQIGNEDKGLKKRLRSKQAMEGILAWAVAGAIDWAANGLPVMEEIVNLTNQQRLESNTVALFIDQCCVREDDAFAPGTALFNTYKDWCRDEGYQPFGRKSFTIGLDSLGIKTLRQSFDLKQQRGFSGIRFVGFGLGDETIQKSFNKVSRLAEVSSLNSEIKVVEA